MGPFLVVIDHPPVCYLPHLGQGVEKVQVQHFFPIGAVKALDIGILIRLARLNVLDHHAVGFSPGDKITA